MNYITLLFVFMSVAANQANAQNIKDHQWDSRIVFLMIEDTSNYDYKQQVADFKQNLASLEERKLIVYHIKADQYKVGLDESSWTKSEKLWKEFKATDAPFEFILFGLDGGIKLRKTDCFPTEELFKVIDVMPMRKEEIRKENKKG